MVCIKRYYLIIPVCFLNLILSLSLVDCKNNLFFGFNKNIFANSVISENFSNFQLRFAITTDAINYSTIQKFKKSVRRSNILMQLK